MALGTDYKDQQDCSIARSLEIVGERWTLLIIRDLFFGLRRYSDIRRHTGVSPAILTERLNGLVAENVVSRVPGKGAHDVYELTPKGEKLWPVISGLAQWGNEFYLEPDARLILSHHQCGTVLDDAGYCPKCEVVPSARNVDMKDLAAARKWEKPRTEPRRLLEPITI